MTKDELIEYTQNRFGSEPEYLWESNPNTFVFRHQNNRTWFAVVMDVQHAKLGLPGVGDVFIMDVKCGPLLGGSYFGNPGILPAWHMNKNHWIGALLDGTAADDTIRELLEISYDLTK